ncbi:uncharacterized protein YecE (DUF72 family) [Tardiphaga robiniae]|jgi:uncharacterized protein YecE (DUF72 family)|uniref:DUF72 domain-containing protein n=1 Tax=Tardiphaga robiniae TaxID=943830 RepID=UPI002857EA9F|nr:DUF72 domain-containing protein [Tardiphaga robiniae]MDR6663296.1 uncharacterized protein YecE (DUF72 family) [Tardiphaga robiniae]
MLRAQPIRIGTAGWSIASDYVAQFPLGGSHLERYARRLAGVEINSSFYKPHRRSTYERWAISTPNDFQFSVKLPRAISHEQALVSCEEPLSRFLDAVSGLGKKLGVVLVQLPPRFEFDDAVFERFFDEFRRRSDVSVAIEPRHASWFADKVAERLTRRRIARVASDPARAASGGLPGGWAGLCYYRWHGAPRVYYSSYDSTELASMAARLLEEKQRQTWFVFDNTASGAALSNALELSSLIE